MRECDFGYLRSERKGNPDKLVAIIVTLDFWSTSRTPRIAFQDAQPLSGISILLNECCAGLNSSVQSGPLDVASNLTYATSVCGRVNENRCACLPGCAHCGRKCRGD